MKLSFIKKELKSNYDRIIEYNEQIEKLIPKIAMLKDRKDETSKAALDVISKQIDSIEDKIKQVEMDNVILEQELMESCLAAKEQELNKVKLPKDIEEQYGTPLAYVKVSSDRLKDEVLKLESNGGWRYSNAKEKINSQKEEYGFVDPSTLNKRDMGSSLKVLAKSKRELEAKEKEAEELADKYFKIEEPGEPGTEDNQNIE